VHELLKSNTVKRRVKFSESGALLQGKLFDDKGNRMGPSFSSKNGVRYRFYVSTALRGRMHKAGSVTRVSAPEIEGLVIAALIKKLGGPKEEMFDQVERITVSMGRVQLGLKPSKGKRASIEIPWTPKPTGAAQLIAPSEAGVNHKLVKSIVRAHGWWQKRQS
jgi:site-specific DNA recombinase